MQNFLLFETMLYHDGKIFLFKNHLQRLLQSALVFNFDSKKLLSFAQSFLHDTSPVLSHYKIANTPLEDFTLFDMCLWESFELSYAIPLCLKPYSLNLDTYNTMLIIKMNLCKNGHFYFEILPYVDLVSKDVFIAKERLHTQNIFLYHKTTIRDHYEGAKDGIAKNLFFDLIYFNEKNELCEGSRSNIILYHNNAYYTPMRQSGLLRGTLLSLFLESDLCKEKVLFHDDLLQAQKIFCLNSVRGLLEVRLCIN